MILFKKKLRLISQFDYFKTVNSFEVLMIYTSWADPSLFNVSSFKDRNTCKENQKQIFYTLYKEFSNEMIISYIIALAIIVKKFKVKRQNQNNQWFAQHYFLKDNIRWLEKLRKL